MLYNGPVGLANWKDYCLDLSDSQLYRGLDYDQRRLCFCHQNILTFG